MAGDLQDIYVRFEGENTQEKALKGDSMDAAHRGDDGWIQIRSFSFGCGFQTKDEKASHDIDNIKRKFYSGKPLSASERKRLEDADKEQQADKKQDKGKKEKKEWGKATDKSALEFERVQLSKAADKMSGSLVDMCHMGNPIDTMTLEACRPVSNDEDIKAPFLRMVFENVTLRNCRLNLATEGLPTEDFEIEFNKVTIYSIWTDNATGERNPEKPIWVSWDLDAQKESDEENDGN